MAEENKACLHAYKLDGNGAGALIDPAVITGPDDGSLLWLHFNGRHPDTKKFMRDVLRLDPLMTKSLLADETRPRLEEIEQGALVILRGIHFHPGPDPEDLVSVRIWIAGNRIITVGRRKSQAISEMSDRLLHTKGPKRAGEFLAMLCNSLHDGIEPVLHDLEETTDALEEKSLDNPGSDLRNDIAMVRKQAILFRRHMSPQKDVVSHLRHLQQDWMTDGDRWYMQDNYDRVTRYIESLDSIRERAQIVQDELTTALTARLNQSIHLLSAITVVFMPLTFLTGLFGINVAGIPWAEYPAAFALFCLFLVVIVIIELALFRRLKWF